MTIHSYDDFETYDYDDILSDPGLTDSDIFDDDVLADPNLADYASGDLDFESDPYDYDEFDEDISDYDSAALTSDRRRIFGGRGKRNRRELTKQQQVLQRQISEIQARNKALQHKFATTSGRYSSVNKRIQDNHLAIQRLIRSQDSVAKALRQQFAVLKREAAANRTLDSKRFEAIKSKVKAIESASQMASMMSMMTPPRGIKSIKNGSVDWDINKDTTNNISGVEYEAPSMMSMLPMLMGSMTSGDGKDSNNMMLPLMMMALNP